MNRAYSLLEIKAVKEDERLIEGIASTPTPDRIGDIVEPMGAQFKLPMPLLWQHHHDEPVGHVEFAKPNKNGIPFKARIVKIDEPGELKNLVDKAWQSVKAKLVRAVSIGFTVEAHEIMKDGGWRINEWEWLELSLVTIPMNAEATIQTVKSIDRDLRAAIGRKQTRSSPRPASGQPENPQTKRNGAMKTYAERIAELEEEITPKRARMDQIMKDAVDDGDRDLNQSEAEEFDGLAAEVKEADVKIRRWQALDKSASTAKAVDTVPETRAAAVSRSGAARPSVAAEAKKQPDGIGFARYAMCFAAAKGDPLRASEIAKHRYPGLHALPAMFKAAVAGHTTVATDSGSALIDPENYMADFIEYLRPRTIVGRFGDAGIPSLRRVPFNIKVPAQLSAGAGYWVGEGRGKGVTQFNFGTVILRWTKAANIAVVSEELLRFSTPSAEVLVRDALAEALQARLDTDFVNPSLAAVEDVNPAGIANSAQTYAATGPTADDARTDLKKLFTYFVAQNIGTSANVLIMREAQAVSLMLMRNALGQKEFPDITRSGGTLEGVPVLTSQYVPQGVIILAQASEIYLADDGQVTIDMSREASLEMDSAPTNTPSSITASPPTPAAASLVSMWQTNSVAIRAERYIHWRRRHDAGVVYLTAAGYGNPDTSPPAAAI